MRLSVEERLQIEKLSSILKKDKTIVRDVLISILMGMTLEIYNDNDEIIIPYICKLKLDAVDISTKKGMYTQVKLQAEPLPALIEEINAIRSGETTPTEEFIKRGIFKEFQSLLDLEDVEIDND